MDYFWLIQVLFFIFNFFIALDLTETKFTPSYLKTFDDPILPYTFLLVHFFVKISILLDVLTTLS